MSELSEFEEMYLKRIFEIYDSIRHESELDQSKLLNYAFKFFNQDSMIGDLAYHLDVELEKVETSDYGRVVAKIEKELP